MNTKSLTAKIGSIEAQLEILRGFNSSKAQLIQQGGLRSLKGILKGKGDFSEEEIEKAKIKFREEL